jgi:putative FmdB family regulatory protein
VPTYQYACTDCGEQLEVVQKFTDDALTTCPACAGRLRKVYSAVGVVFKGSGFYRTDSRADGKPVAAKDGKDTGSKDSTSDSRDGAAVPAGAGTSASTSGPDKPGTSGSSGSTAKAGTSAA